MKTLSARILRLALLLATLAPAAARAEDAPEASSSDGWVPVRHLRFSDEDIQGGTWGGDGELLQVVQPATHASLIEIRQGFEAELVKTMEDF